jgi:dolichol-phosphate mannosyltransferase
VCFWWGEIGVLRRKAQGMSARGNPLVAVATYNEIENLPRLVDEIFHYLPEAEVLVIDDNSPDGTGRWAAQRAAEDARVHCIHRAGKLGLGTATVAGMRYAITEGYPYVITMDADFSHHPKYLPALVGGMESAGPDRGPVDVMIGSRYVPGGGVEGWPLRRHLMSRAVNFYARLLLRLPVRDCSGAFRCYRVATLQRIDFDRVRSRGYSFQEEILWHLRRAGARFAETPIIFVDRRAGRSKINLREAFGALWIIFRLALSR